MRDRSRYRPSLRAAFPPAGAAQAESFVAHCAVVASSSSRHLGEEIEKLIMLAKGCNRGASLAPRPRPAKPTISSLGADSPQRDSRPLQRT
jgi:hypothetical protein